MFTGTPLAAVGRWLKSWIVAERSEDEEEELEEEDVRPEPASSRRMVVRSDEPEPIDVEVEEGEDEEEPEPIRPAKLASARGGYKLPPLDLLRKAPASAADGLDEEQTMEALERTFQTFGVPASVPAAHRGPTVTQYEVEVEAGTKVNRVLQLADDI